MQKRPLAFDPNHSQRKKYRQAREEALTPLQESLLCVSVSLPGSSFRDDLELIDHLREVDASGREQRLATLVAICLDAVFNNLTNTPATGKQDGGHRKNAPQLATPAGDHVLHSILSLPSHLRNSLFKRLRIHAPTVLTRDFLESFLKADTSPVVNLSNLAIGDRILLRLPQRSSNLRRLCLNNIENISDRFLARVLLQLTSLEIIELRATQAGNLSALAIAKHPRAASLKGLNFNYSAVTCKGVIELAHACTGLEVLKIAGINSVTSGVIKRMLGSSPSELNDGTESRTLPLSRLKKIKIRATSCDNSGLEALLSRCGRNLHAIDISLTDVKNITLITNFLKREFAPSSGVHDLSTSTNVSPLRKLDLRDVNPPFTALPGLLQTLHVYCPHFVTLLLGKTGYPSPAYSYERIAPYTFENLVRLDLSDRPRRGVKKVLQMARRLKILDLSNTGIGVEDLKGLIFSDEGSLLPSVLQELDVSFTRLGDEVAPIIAQCECLQILNFSSTCITAQGVREIVARCDRLQNIRTSGCRRVPPAERSKLFQTVKRELADKQVSPKTNCKIEYMVD